MTKLFKFAGVNLLIGMNWSVAQDKSDRSKIFSENKGKSYVSLRDDSSEIIGFSNEIINEHCYAGSAIIAAVIRDAIIAVSIDDDSYWLTVIHNGVPLPTKDVILNRSEIYDSVTDLLAVYGSASFYADLNGSFGSESDLESLIKERIDNDENILKTTKIKSPASIKRIAITVASLLTILMTIYFTVVTFFINPQKEQSKNKNQSEQIEKARRATIEKLINNHFFVKNQKINQLKKSLEKNNMASWLSFIKKLPLQQFGYKPVLVECEAQICTVNWVSSGFQVKETDKYRISGVATDAVFSQQQGQVQSRYSTETLNRAILGTIPLHDMVKKPDETTQDTHFFRAVMLDQIKFHGASVALDPFVADVVPGVQDADIPDSQVSISAKMQVSFQGASANMALTNFIHFFDGQPIIVDKLSFKPPSFSAGSYQVVARYVIATTPLNEKNIQEISWTGIGQKPVVNFQPQ